MYMWWRWYWMNLGCARFTEILSELTKTWTSGATECRVWIGNCNVKVWKSTEHKLHNIWRSLEFQQNEHTPGWLCLGVCLRLTVWLVNQWHSRKTKSASAWMHSDIRQANQRSILDGNYCLGCLLVEFTLKTRPTTEKVNYKLYSTTS